jgi:hypothetical protein
MLVFHWGGIMARRSFRSIATGTACSALLLAGLPSIIEATHAADLPLFAKAAPASDPGNRFWAEIDYLGWSVKGDRLPPMVTTSPAGTPLPLAGVVGAPGTTVLFGNSAVNDGWRSGGRLQAGYWLDPQRNRGIEVSFFDLQSASTGFATDSRTHPILAQPFVNALTGNHDAMLVGFPGLVTGAVAVSETSRLLGAGGLYRQDLGVWGDQKISALIGYRYLHSSDGLSIPYAGNVGGISITSDDAFHARTDFHGIDLGLAGEWKRGPWSLEWRGKIAIGADLTSADISGTTSITAGGVTTTSPGGLHALPSNIGSMSQTHFAAVPEVTLKVAYRIAPPWQIVAGYDVLYWTGVQRAGGLIDTTINPNLIPPGALGGPQRPQPVFNTQSLLAQGFTLGVRYNY